MKNLHRRAKLQDSEENGVIMFSIHSWSDYILPLDLLYIKHEYIIYFGYAGL